MNEWRTLSDGQLKIIAKKHKEQMLIIIGVCFLLNVMLLICAFLFSYALHNKVPYILYGIATLGLGAYVLTECVKMRNQEKKQVAIALDVECINKDCNYDVIRHVHSYYVTFAIYGKEITALVSGEIFEQAKLGTKLTVVHFAKEGEGDMNIDEKYIDGVYIASDLA